MEIMSLTEKYDMVYIFQTTNPNRIKTNEAHQNLNSVMIANFDHDVKS